MNEAAGIAARDRVAKKIGLPSNKANVVFRGESGRGEIAVMCADGKILANCEKLLPKDEAGIPIKVMLRPAPGSTNGLRVNTNFGRIVLRDK